MILAGIELGGTKTIAALGDAGGNIIESVRFETTSPDKLIDRVCNYLVLKSSSLGPICGVGVGAFGPVVVNPRASNYGRLLKTNKSGWSGFDLAGSLAHRLPVPLALVTDVAAAGIAEARLGHLRGIELGLYLTIGTGIGGALLHNGQPLPALLHPEMGHLPLRRHPDDATPSACTFHSDCAEGLAAGPAIMARCGAWLSHFPPDGPEYHLVADYVGQLLASFQLSVSPQRIVIGGGVAQAAGLMDLIGKAMQTHLGGYVECDFHDPDFLVSPKLGGDAGVTGALLAAAAAADNEKRDWM